MTHAVAPPATREIPPALPPQGLEATAPVPNSASFDLVVDPMSNIAGTIDHAAGVGVRQLADLLPHENPMLLADRVAMTGPGPIDQLRAQRQRVLTGRREAPLPVRFEAGGQTDAVLLGLGLLTIEAAAAAERLEQHAAKGGDTAPFKGEVQTAKDRASAAEAALNTIIASATGLRESQVKERGLAAQAIAGAVERLAAKTGLTSEALINPVRQNRIQ